VTIDVALLAVGVTGLTSVCAWFVASRWLRLPTGDLIAAVRRMLDCVGTMIIFTVGNLAVGAALILGLRVLGGRFVSLYVLGDDVWFVLSALQGLTWSLWRQKHEPTEI
jgi:hypothetical protein